MIFLVYKSIFSSSSVKSKTFLTVIMSINSISFDLSITMNFSISSPRSFVRKFSVSVLKSSKQKGFSFPEIGLKISKIIFSFVQLNIELYTSKTVNNNIDSLF